MKVLITGSAGYIGTNLKALFDEKDIRYVEVDKVNGVRAENIPNLGGCEAVVHLAALSGIPDCDADPKDAALSNIAATYNIFHLALEEGIPVVFASSQAAKTPTVGIYGFTKFAGEQEAFRLNKIGGHIRVYRFANVYGGLAYEKKGTVVSAFLKRKKAGLPLIINGDGMQSRDFIHAYDICNAIYLGLMKDIPVDKPIDVGSGEEVSIITLASMFDHPYEFDYNGRPGVSSSVANVTRAKKLLGFEPVKNLEEFINQEV